MSAGTFRGARRSARAWRLIRFPWGPAAAPLNLSVRARANLGGRLKRAASRARPLTAPHAQSAQANAGGPFGTSAFAVDGGSLRVVCRPPRIGPRWPSRPARHYSSGGRYSFSHFKSASS